MRAGSHVMMKTKTPGYGSGVMPEIISCADCAMSGIGFSCWFLHGYGDFFARSILRATLRVKEMICAAACLTLQMRATQERP